MMFAVPKPAGLFRVVVLGDSLTFGYQLPVEDAFPQQLGRLLAERTPPIEVCNLGIAGYNALQEVELMETVFPHPTLSEMMHESVLDAYGRIIHY